MKRVYLLLLPLAFACKTTPERPEDAKDGEVSISARELEPVTLFLGTRRVLAAEGVLIRATPQYYEERMGFTRDLRYVARKKWTLKDGTRVIELRNINTQKSNIDPDLLPRVYFGTGLEIRAFRVMRVYLTRSSGRERPLSIEVIGKNTNGDAKLWVSGRLQHEQPQITIRSELIWSEDKERYLHRSSVG